MHRQPRRHQRLLLNLRRIIIIITVTTTTIIITTTTWTKLHRLPHRNNLLLGQCGQSASTLRLGALSLVHRG